MRATVTGLVGLLMTLLVPTVVSAAQIYTSSLTITKEDLIETDAGRKVKELNDEMRQWAEAADKLDKGTGPYNAIKEKFDELKRERDEVGKNLRGLRGKELVFYGDKANGDAYDFKRRFIARWQQDPAFREYYSGGMVHVSYDKSGQQRVQTTPPRPEDVDSYVAEADTDSQFAVQPGEDPRADGGPHTRDVSPSKTKESCRRPGAAAARLWHPGGDH